jgi:hypothetical protein
LAGGASAESGDAEGHQQFAVRQQHAKKQARLTLVDREHRERSPWL